MNQLSDLKKRDVNRLLQKHFGDQWRQREELKFYDHVLDGSNSSQLHENIQGCEFIEEGPIIVL